MEMQQLRYVVAVARTGNFSRAAALCHVAQPSLSQQIQKLEEELGERIFDRLKREAKPTRAGEAFLRRAVRILEEADEARREAQNSGALLRTQMAIGVLPTIAPHLLPAVMTHFLAHFPDVKIELQEDMTERLLQRVLAYELDFALVSLPINDARLEISVLFSEPLLLALPPGHALARKRTINAADLETERLIVMKEGHCLGDQVLGFCDRNQVKAQIGFRSAQLETVQALVQEGLGISLIPEMATRFRGPAQPVYRTLPKLKPERKIVAVWPRRRAPGRAAQEFLRAVEAWCALQSKKTAP